MTCKRAKQNPRTGYYLAVTKHGDSRVIGFAGIGFAGVNAGSCRRSSNGEVTST